MAFPRTFVEMKEQGYRFLGDAKCRSCGADIEFWLTVTHKKIPMNHMPGLQSEAVPHWKTCPDAKEWRRW